MWQFQNCSSAPQKPQDEIYERQRRPLGKRKSGGLSSMGQFIKKSRRRRRRRRNWRPFLVQCWKLLASRGIWVICLLKVTTTDHENEIGRLSSSLRRILSGTETCFILHLINFTCHVCPNASESSSWYSYQSGGDDIAALIPISLLLEGIYKIPCH